MVRKVTYQQGRTVSYTVSVLSGSGQLFAFCNSVMKSIQSLRSRSFRKKRKCINSSSIGYVPTTLFYHRTCEYGLIISIVPSPSHQNFWLEFPQSSSGEWNGVFLLTIPNSRGVPKFWGDFLRVFGRMVLIIVLIMFQLRCID